MDVLFLAMLGVLGGFAFYVLFGVFLVIIIFLVSWLFIFEAMKQLFLTFALDLFGTLILLSKNIF